MIKGTIKHQKLFMSAPWVVGDSYKYLEAEFSFETDDWAGLQKIVYFKRGNQEPLRFLLKNDKISQEAQLNLQSGDYAVYIIGYDTDKTQRITTTLTSISVKSSGPLDGEPIPIIPSIGEQILAKADNAEKIAQSVRNDADSGVFNGKSAYDIAVENGFKGTEAEWLLSLRGENATSGGRWIVADQADSEKKVFLNTDKHAIPSEGDSFLVVWAVGNTNLKAVGEFYQDSDIEVQVENGKYSYRIAPGAVPAKTYKIVTSDGPDAPKFTAAEDLTTQTIMVLGNNTVQMADPPGVSNGVTEEFVKNYAQPKKLVVPITLISGNAYKLPDDVGYRDIELAVAGGKDVLLDNKREYAHITDISAGVTPHIRFQTAVNVSSGVAKIKRYDLYQSGTSYKLTMETHSTFKDVLVAEVQNQSGSWTTGVGSAEIRDFQGIVILKAEVDGIKYVYYYHHFDEGVPGNLKADAVFTNEIMGSHFAKHIEIRVDASGNVTRKDENYLDGIRTVQSYNIDDSSRPMRTTFDNAKKWTVPGSSQDWTFEEIPEEEIATLVIGQLISIPLDVLINATVYRAYAQGIITKKEQRKFTIVNQGLFWGERTPDTCLNIRTTNGTGSVDLKPITKAKAEEYASTLTPWNSTEIPADRIAAMTVGCTVIIEVSVDGTTAYIVGIVKEVEATSCRILGLELIEPGTKPVMATQQNLTPAEQEQARKNINSSKQPLVIKSTLTVARWASNLQTVENSGFKSTNCFYIYRPEGDPTAYNEAIIWTDPVTEDGKMVFHCKNTPTKDISLTILEVSV